MKLALINGSPRGKKSNSDRILSWITSKYDEKIETQKIYAANKKFIEDVDTIANADYYLFIFPLYTDSMPALTKEIMEEMYNNQDKFANKPIGFIVHSGFPEALQSRPIVKYLEYYANLMSMKYMGSIIMAGSEGLQIAPDEYFGKRFKAFDVISQDIISYRAFNEEAMKIIAGKERLSKIAQFVTNNVPLTDFYFNKQLKDNNVFDIRYDKPYE